MPYPSGLTTLLRFDPTQPAYQDLAQSTLAVAPSDRVRSIPQPSPLSGSWTASGDTERPVRYAADTLACDPLALDYPTHLGQFLNAPAGALSSISMNSCTLAFCFRPFALYNAPANGLFGYGSAWGLELNGSGVAVRYNGGAQLYQGVLLGKDIGVNLDGDSGAGNLVCFVVRFRPTGIDLYVDEEGTVYSPAPLVATINPGAPPAIYLGQGTGMGSGLFGQAAIIDGSVSDAKRDELIAWMKSSAPPQAFPTSRDLVAVMADSIGSGVGNTAPQRWSNRMLANLRPTYPALQMLNVSIGGSGVPPMSGPVSTQYKTVRNHLSVARRRTVVVLGFGTNDVKGDPTDSGVDAALGNLFALSDDLRSRGALVAVENVLPRSDLPNPTAQTNFNHGRARWNSALDANVGTRFDRLIDLRGVPGVGADGDSNNLTYYPDKIHPSPAASILIEPAFTAAVASLLAEYVEEDDDEPRVLSSVLTYDQDTWHRPGVDELGGGSQENVTPPRDPRTVPHVDAFNQLVRQIVAQATLAVSARVQVEFPGGVPTVTAVTGLNTTLVPADFTVTDNGNGDTSLTLAKYQGEQLRPSELTIAEDVEIDRECVFPIANGWRVKTKLGATGTNAAFVLALHAPAQH